MKFFKLSLVALAGITGLGVQASATSLEDAIKNVDISGNLRYRYTNTRTKKAEGANIDSSATHRFRGRVNLDSTIDDNLFFKFGIEYVDESPTSSGKGTDYQYPSGESDNRESDPDKRITGNINLRGFNVRESALGYKYGNNTFLLGQQVLSTFFTDDIIGVGISAVNTSIPGLNLTAIAADNLNNDGDISFSSNGTNKSNFFALGVTGSYDPIGFQLWGAKAKHIVNLAAAEFTANVASAKFTGQAAYSGFNSSVRNFGLPAADGSQELGAKLSRGYFYGAQVETDNSDIPFDGSIGYLRYGTYLNQKSFISYEDVGLFIIPGEQVIGYDDVDGKNSYIFLTAGYTVDKVRIGGDFIIGDNKIDVNTTDKNRELVARLRYNYSEKLYLKSYFSNFVSKHKIKDTKDTSDVRNRFRVEVRYTFG